MSTGLVDQRESSGNNIPAKEYSIFCDELNAHITETQSLALAVPVPGNNGHVKSNNFSSLDPSVLSKNCFECEFCNNSYDEYQKVRGHIDKKHGRCTNYCYECEEILNEHQLTLKFHMLNNHRNLVTCDQCNDKITSWLDLQQHKETEHGNNSYTCKLCESQAMSLEEYATHRQLQHKPEYYCELCDFKTEEFSELKDHKYINHGKKYFIVNTSANGNFLDETMGVLVQPIKKPPLKQIHTHDAGSTEEHCCEVCEFKTNRVSALRKHRIRAHNKPRHSCHLCAFVGASSTGLVIHLRSHPRVRHL